MKDSLNLLFVHAPRFSSHYRPYGPYMTINLLPMGTFALADLAAKNGYTTEILHLGLEWIKTGRFSPADHLKNKKVQVAALPLHWHQQSYDALETAKLIKQEQPDVFLVLGGATASFFHREILSSFPQVDAIIRGDAEEPLLALMRAVTAGGNLADVPNLAWRDNGELRENTVSYVAGPDDLERATYTNLHLLKDHQSYIRYMGMPFVWAKNLSPQENKKHFHLGYPIFFLNIGRGCSGNCTWCGGGARAQRMVSGRTGVVFRLPEKVADSASEAAALGYEMIHIAFDPFKDTDDYYRELFSIMRQRRLRLRCYFESFSLPSAQFLKEFAGTFILQDSVVAISPETGDEKVRDMNRSFSFSNSELKAAVAASEKLGIKIDLFFAMGIPGEKYSGLAKTAALRKDMQKKFTNIGRVWTSPISLEPAAPWQCAPVDFGIVSTRQSFDDYYRASAPGGGGPGYYIPDYAGDGQRIDAAGFAELLRKARCRSHCSLHRNPAKAGTPLGGRMYCLYMQWKTRGCSE